MSTITIPMELSSCGSCYIVNPYRAILDELPIPVGKMLCTDRLKFYFQMPDPLPREVDLILSTRPLKEGYKCRMNTRGNGFSGFMFIEYEDQILGEITHYRLGLAVKELGAAYRYNRKPFWLALEM
jgi:hypothetical protein